MKFKDKCEICQSKIQKTILDKIIGTSVRDSNSKKRTVCFECQKKFKTREELLAQLS